MNKHLLVAAVLAAAGSALVSTAFARGADDGVLDLRGHAQDPIQKRQGADNGPDLRGHGQDVLLKRNGADNGADLRGHGQDVLLKRQGADDPVNHIRRARGADNLVNMRDARNHR